MIERIVKKRSLTDPLFDIQINIINHMSLAAKEFEP